MDRVVDRVSGGAWKYCKCKIGVHVHTLFSYEDLMKRATFN